MIFGWAYGGDILRARSPKDRVHVGGEEKILKSSVGGNFRYRIRGFAEERSVFREAGDGGRRLRM